MKIRDRVVKMVKVKASELVPCPWNFRTHPRRQRDAMRAVLEEIGMAGAVLVRELPDGRLGLVDGHLRREELGNHVVTALVLDVTEKESRKLLMAYDAVGDLAEIDQDKFKELLARTKGVGQGLSNLFAGVVEGFPEAVLPPLDFAEFGEDLEVEHECPKCGYRFSGGKQVAKKKT